MDATPEAIEAQLAQIRAELSESINELAGMLDPKKLGEQAKEQALEKVGLAKDQALEKVSQAKSSAMGLIDDARAGDTRAMAIVAGTAIGLTLAIGLLASRGGRDRA